MSIEHNSSGRKLSKAVLDLKFMKKSKEKREILDDAEERQQLYQDQLSMLHEGADRIVMLNSYSDCMKFLPCRLSFGGMDPAIEKLNEDRLTGLYKVAKEEAASLGQQFTGMAADVDEEEMAGSCLASNIRKKFGMKRKSNPDELDSEEEGDNGNRKKFKEEDDEDHKGPKVMQRKLFTFNADGPRGRGRGDFRGRGRGDFGGRGGRGRGDFGGRGGRGRGDFGGRGGRGRGDFGGRGGRGRGDFGGRGGRGRGDFKGRGRGDFGRRGQGDSRGRGRGKRGGFQDRGKRNFDDGIEADQDSGNFEGDNQDSYDNENGSFYVDAKPGKMEHAPKKKKFLKPSSD